MESLEMEEDISGIDAKKKKKNLDETENNMEKIPKRSWEGNVMESYQDEHEWRKDPITTGFLGG